MGDERAFAAIGRIERALGRLDAVARRPAPAAPPAANATDERLSAAHAALRGKVEAAIAQIDVLLADGEQG